MAKDELFEKRLEKLNRLRDKGIDPYPNKFARSHTTVEARAILEKPGENQDVSEITLAGRFSVNEIYGAFNLCCNSRW